ncbi:hypothetical protein BX600DRAFT_457156 [Xylariales sp. PMI_506]|nr:hypothetical protein BX600DRAFT_457156 [Xylariales sp. PMI_506]
MRLLTIASVLAQLLISVSAETAQEDWTFPQSPDYATTIEIGQEITIGWTTNLQTWFSAYCPGCVLTSANLYITSVGISGITPYTHQIASGIDVTSELSLNWTSTLPLSEYSCNGCNAWAFVFMQDGINGDVSSSTFYVMAAGSDSTTSSTATTSTTTTAPSVASFTTIVTLTSSPTSTTTSTASTPSAISSAPEQTTGLGVGAKAGIGIGAALGALGLVALGWFLRSKGSSSAAGAGATKLSPTRSEFGNTPRHRPLADFLSSRASDAASSPGWDPADTFYKRGDADSDRRLTHPPSSYELLPKPG